MTTNNPDSGNNLGLPRDPSQAGIRARIGAYCAQFEIDPPKLKIHKGSVYLDDTLLHWCDDNGASLDWIILGNVEVMADAHRKARLYEIALKKIDSLPRAD